MKWKSNEKAHVHLPGPGQEISCDYTDELESLSVKKHPVVVSYGAEKSEIKTSTGLITDFITRNRVDYMIMSDGCEIPLKQIQAIKSYE
jgi:hypothetical protein